MTRHSEEERVSPVIDGLLCARKHPIAISNHTADGCGSLQQVEGLPGDGIVRRHQRLYLLIGLTVSNSAQKSVAKTCKLQGRADSSLAVAQTIVETRISSRQVIEFINSHSKDHTWRASGEGSGNHSVNSDPASDEMDGDSDVMGIVPVMAMSMTASWNSSRSWSGKLEFNTVESTAQLGFVVGLRKDRYGQNFCGGSLIASSYVLTAAHCVAGNNAKFVSVGSRASAGTETEAIAIRKVRVHPRYGFASKFSYDVAILELDSQAYPQPIVLDNAAGFDASDRFTLYGYGADSADSDELSTVLRSVELPFFPEKRCLKTFPELDSSALCAGGELARDACTGDSGSPLVNWIDNAPYLSGLVSSGRSGCGTPGVPGIYARVSSVTAFIDSYVAGHKWRYEPTEPSFPSSTSETMLVPSMGGPREGVIPRSTSGPPDRASSGSTSIRSRSSTTIVNRDGSTPSSPRPRGPSSAAEPETGEDSLNNWPMSLPSLRSANGNSGAAVSPRADSTGGQPSEVYDGALQALELVDEIPQLVDKSLVKFFMGNYSMFMAWRPPLLDAEAVRLTFYSSGNLTRLLNVITSNSELPLHNRRNRFSIVTTAYDATPRAASDAAHC